MTDGRSLRGGQSARGAKGERSEGKTRRGSSEEGRNAESVAEGGRRIKARKE